MLHLNTEIDTTQLPLLYSLIKSSMEEGVKIEIPVEFRRKLEADKSFLQHKFSTRYNVANPESPKQLQAEIERLSVEYPELRTACFDEKTGKWTTKAEALEKVSTLNLDFINDLQLLRSILALTKNFNSLEAAQDSKGYIHPEVSSLITNRVSYSKPALMNIPKKILWQVVRPRKEGWHIFRVDIKNQEPWIFINSLGVQKLQFLLQVSGNIGLYRMIYNDIYGAEPNDLQYKEAKTTWNALTYGSSKKSILEKTFHLGETQDTPSDNGRKFYEYFNSFPEIKKYQKEKRAQAYSGVRSVKTLFGAEIQLGPCNPAQASRYLMDYWIQGTGADILSFLVWHFNEYIEKYHMKEHLRLYYTRHDEVVIEVSPEFFERFGENGCHDKFNYIFRHTINNWNPCELEIEHVKQIPDLTIEDLRADD